VTSHEPDLGLLLDVDGPIASPVTRTIAIPSISEDLVELANTGTPVAFNTGRSDAFLRDEIAGALIAAGLSDTARVFGVCEKGAVWFRITPQGVGPVSVDESLTLPSDFRRAVDALMQARFADAMFFDHTKRAMLSVEQRIDIESDDYLAVQPVFEAQVLDLCRDFDLGTVWRNIERPASDGSIRFRIDPTIISTDIESIRSGKDLGAERALRLLAEAGPLPRTWRTVGDSRTDYAMADWLHHNGYAVAHVDVRPRDGMPVKPYDILTATDDLTNDAAAAEFLRRWVGTAEGESLVGAS
jgi:hypothetical protein